MNYLNFEKNRPNYSFKHSFTLIFKKIETVLFSFLCVIFLAASQIDRDFSKNISFAFVNISLPIVKFAAFPFNSAINLLTDFGELINAKKENKILKDELEKLKIFYVNSLNINQENQELRNTLNFVSAKSSTFKVAQIIGRSNQLFNQKVFIDAGKNRDLKEGQIVTGNRAVIGRIDEVVENKSRLILLNDVTSRIPVIASQARVRGVLAGAGAGLMEILYLPKNHKIEVGDTIFTSGDGDTLPPGLFVGVVQRITADSAFVTMAEDIANVDIVSIINY